MLLATGACATHATPPIADSACVTFRPISYAKPQLQPDGTRNMPADPGNKFDTLETSGEVEDHNARYDATCPPAD